MAKIVKGNIEATGQIKGATIVGALTGDITGNVTGNLTGNVTGNLTGNVTGTADVSTAVAINANNSTNETVYLTFVDGATGNQALETDTALTYNPSTNQLSAVTSGSIAVQNVTGAGSNNHYIPVVNTFNGNSSLFGDANLEFNSSTNTLTTANFSGLLNGNVVGDIVGGLTMPSTKTITGLHTSNTISTAGNISVTSSGSAVIAPEVQSAKITHRSSDAALVISSIDDVKVVLDEGTDNSAGTFTIHKNADSNPAVFSINESGITTAGQVVSLSHITSTNGDIATTNGNVYTVNGNLYTTNGNITAGGDITVGDDLYINGSSTAVVSSVSGQGTYITFSYAGSTRGVTFNTPDFRLAGIPEETSSFVTYYLGVRTAEGNRVYRDDANFFTGTHIYKAASDLVPGTAVELVNGSVQATSSANSAICVGIVVQTVEATTDNPIETSLGENLTSGWVIKLASVGDVKHRSSTGFLVCNEGGNIAPGDLLVTSSTPGYLMKQADDIIRSTTIGKAMEAPSFDENGQASGIYGYIYCG